MALYLSSCYPCGMMTFDFEYCCQVFFFISLNFRVDLFLNRVLGGRAIKHTLSVLGLSGCGGQAGGVIFTALFRLTGSEINSFKLDWSGEDISKYKIFIHFKSLKTFFFFFFVQHKKMKPPSVHSPPFSPRHSLPLLC